MNKRQNSILCMPLQLQWMHFCLITIWNTSNSFNILNAIKLVQVFAYKFEFAFIKLTKWAFKTFPVIYQIFVLLDEISRIYISHPPWLALFPIHRPQPKAPHQLTTSNQHHLKCHKARQVSWKVCLCFVLFSFLWVCFLCCIHSEAAIFPLPSIPSLLNFNYHTWILYVALLLESIWKTWCIPSCPLLIRLLPCCSRVTYENVYGIVLWWTQSVYQMVPAEYS